MTSFLPTIAKQMGYSTLVVGVIYSILPILSLLTKPIVGAIVDQFRVKKTVFLTFILLSGVTAFSLMFVPEIPLKTTAELNCHDITYLNVCSKDNLSLSKCDAQRVMKHKSKSRFVGCLVNVHSSCIFIILMLISIILII